MDEERCVYRHCTNTFRPQREAQRFCSPRCREAYAYDVRRAKKGLTQPRKVIAGSMENGAKNLIQTIPCKPTTTTLDEIKAVGIAP
jgi:predicted nucleic acid-binding Zn ribbon protein